MTLIRLIDLPALIEFVENLGRTFLSARPIGNKLRAWFGVPRGSRSAGSGRQARLFVERLEDRTVPSTFTVNELGDTNAVNRISGVDATGHTSLRSALEAANYLGGDQTIQFDMNVFAAPRTIKLTLGVLGLKDAGTLTIQGPAAGVNISGNHTSEVFLVASGTTADLTGLTISAGMTSGVGGGIYNKGTLTINDCTIAGNAAAIYYFWPVCYGYGGGIYNTGSLTLKGSTISGNTAACDGGGIYNAAGATAELTGCTVTGNSCPYTWGGNGGGIWSDGTASLTACTISRNSGFDGGGICCGGSLTVTDSIISRNASRNPFDLGMPADLVGGGGIYNSGTATLVDSTLSGNTASGTGGGICGYGYSSAVLTDCTLSNNSAYSGGGIGCPTPQPGNSGGGDPVMLTNCTISGNAATSNGGGIYIGANNEVTADDTTISANRALRGGGISNGGALTLNNTLIAGNHSLDGDLAGAVTSPSFHNLIGNGAGVTAGISNFTNGNQVGTRAAPINPMLAPLGNYGGPTQTMALVPGSAAIDAGSNAAIPAGVTTDQRGEPRIFNGTVDIGAVELVPSDEIVTLTSADHAVFVVGQAGSFTITTTGLPWAVLSETGDLPAGVTFTDNGNGTAILRGTPAAGAASQTPYSCTVQADNGMGSPATQTFALTVNQAPSITSSSSTTLVVGQANSLTVTTTGFPLAALTVIGTLPAGLTWTDNGDGTATLGGTPLPGTARLTAYKFTIQASNGVGAVAKQSFKLLIDEAPVIASAGSTAFAVGKASSFLITTTGFPSATLSITGALPPGVVFINHGNGTATLGGIPKAGAATGTPYTLTIQADNGVGAMVTQTFTLTINQAPAITSASSATFVAGLASSFTITTAGFPAAALTETGTLLAGMTWTDNGNGTATLSGTPLPDAARLTPYSFVIEASNGVGAVVKRTFKLLIR